MTLTSNVAGRNLGMLLLGLWLILTGLLPLLSIRIFFHGHYWTSRAWHCRGYIDPAQTLVIENYGTCLVEVRNVLPLTF